MICKGLMSGMLRARPQMVSVAFMAGWSGASSRSGQRLADEWQPRSAKRTAHQLPARTSTNALRSIAGRTPAAKSRVQLVCRGVVHFIRLFGRTAWRFPEGTSTFSFVQWWNGVPKRTARRGAALHHATLPNRWHAEFSAIGSSRYAEGARTGFCANSSGHPWPHASRS